MQQQLEEDQAECTEKHFHTENTQISVSLKAEDVYLTEIQYDTTIINKYFT